MMTMSPGLSVGQVHFLQIGAKDFRVGGAFDGHATGGIIQTDGGDHGGDFPMSAGSTGMNPFASQSAPPQPGHVGFRSAFIQEDESSRVPPGLPPTPPTAG